MKPILFAIGLAASASVAGAPARAETIVMDEVAVEGEVQKPEVVFLADRPDRVAARDGIAELRENFLRRIVADARRLADEEAR